MRLHRKIIIIVILVIILSALSLGGLNMMREINDEKSFSMDEINSIQMDMTSIGAHIMQIEEGKQVKIHLHGKAMQEMKLVSKTENDELFIKVQRKHEKLPIYEEVALDVYIPRDYRKSLSIKTLSGEVRMDSIELTNFTLDTSSGKLKAEELFTEKTSITSSSGEINIKSIETKEFQVAGKSSAINIDQCSTINAEMETSSGNINLKNTIGNFTVKSSSGKVCVNYRNFENQKVKITTDSGSITLGLPDSAEFLLEARTSSGSFKTDFPINISDKKNIKGQIGTKNNEVIFQTLSGSMKILKY